MKKIIFAALVAFAAATPSFAEETAAPAAVTVADATVSVSGAAVAVTPARREMITSADGARLGRVERFADDGSPRIILEGAVVTVPLATLSRADDRLVTSLTRREVLAQN